MYLVFLLLNVVMGWVIFVAVVIYAAA